MRYKSKPKAIFFFFLQNYADRAGEIVQWVRPRALLPENLSLIPSIRAGQLTTALTLASGESATFLICAQAPPPHTHTLTHICIILKITQLKFKDQIEDLFSLIFYILIFFIVSQYLLQFNLREALYSFFAACLNHKHYHSCSSELLLIMIYVI